MGRVMDAIMAKGLPKRDTKNANRVNMWAIGWVISLAISTYFAERLVGEVSIALLAFFAIHLFCGVALLRSYRRFLIELDEMERKVQLEAMASAVGLTLLVFSAGGILARAEIVPDLDPAILIVVMSLTYMAGLIIGRIRLA